MKWLLTLLLLSPVAFADEPGACLLAAPASLSLPSATPEAMSPVVYSHIDVDCDAGVAYQLEVQNAQVGGRVDLVADGVATAIPMSLLQSDNRRPWGAINQGEAVAGVGQGEAVSHPVEMSIHLSHLPAPGVYRALLDLAIVF